MRILIVANHFCVCSARYATDAFTRLGHEVRHVGPAMGRSIWGMEVPQEYVWEPNIPLMGKEFGFEPDVTIVMDSDPQILDGVTGVIRHFDTPTTIVWGVDNHVRDYRRPYFDHYFLAHRNVSVMAWWHGEDYALGYRTVDKPDMTYLPCAYDPIHFTPSPIPYMEREYDVCMIGVMYPERWRLVHELKAAGIKVLAGTGLIYEAYRDAYHNARISLCSSSNGDVGQRVFETAMLGNVVMTDKCPDFQLLKPLGFWDYERDADIVSEVRQVLADPERAQGEISWSQEWAKEHTWDNRARQIIEWWEGQTR